MARADQDHARGYFDALVHFSSDASGIHVAGVRNQASARANFFECGAVRKEGVDGSAQAVRIIWIKAAGDSGRANHGEP